MSLWLIRICQLRLTREDKREVMSAVGQKELKCEPLLNIKMSCLEVVANLLKFLRQIG